MKKYRKLGKPGVIFWDGYNSTNRNKGWTIEEKFYIIIDHLYGPKKIAILNQMVSSAGIVTINRHKDGWVYANNMYLRYVPYQAFIFGNLIDNANGLIPCIDYGAEYRNKLEYWEG